MTYHCGMGAGMARYGFTPGPPRITCDGCGLVMSAVTKSGGAKKWLLDGKAPRGWKLFRFGPFDCLRRDYCPKCEPPEALEGDDHER